MHVPVLAGYDAVPAATVLDVGSLLGLHSACTCAACTRNCLEVKLLLYEISPLVEPASFPEAQGNLGDWEISSVAFTTIQSCPV